MGDAQSAQRGSSRAAAAEEEGGKVDDARAEQNTEDKPLKNNGQISEINGKADSTIAEVNGHCEDEIAAEAILSPDEDVSETAKSLKEDETPLENVEINEKESPNEVDAEPMEMIEMDAKQNDINESFRKFFSNIGLKLTVKRGSAEKAEMTTDVPDETNKEESNKPEYIEGTATETKSESAEQNIDLTTAQETCDNDSTTCPTLTDVTSEEVLENAEEKTTEAKEEVESDNVDAVTTSPINEDEKAQQDVTLEEDQQPTSPSSPEAEVVVSPIKRFFTTGIFSGLRKKKKPIEDETNEKELVEIGKKETVETAEETVDVQQDKAEISLGVEADTLETELKANKLKEEILSAAPAQTTDDGKSPPTDPVTITVSEPEIMSSQEKVQASPLKRLLSGSSLKKLSKKQKGRKSSDTKLSDSGEHFSDQLVSSNESAEYHREESPVQHSAEAAGEEDGAWASFKKLVTPKKRMKTSSLTNEETQIPGSAEETKPSEGEQISDHSTEEGKKRKDSSVSWEAVLCGSGRRRSRSRKTSDSEDETPQVENDNKKQESPIESSNEADEILAIAPKQAGSPSEVDGGLTWKSFKKLVTPKRKAKEEEETKDSIQSDREITQDDPSFSIKKLIPGRKKRKSTEKQDQISSDEADKEVVSGDEDSETPAVVPLSEFDTTETGIHIKTQAEVESHVSKEADNELQQDLLDQMDEPVLPCDSQQTEAEKVQGNEETLENEASATPASNEESEDLTELISKHQQLSDIPEEGIITETMATPGSITEEAARDDTIAEDLIEITSEAITAPEPVDITLTDETEMISAVSQLSESSKTSGNTTPVPVEYDVKHTEEFLHQVVETMSVSPKAAPLCSDEVSSERIVGSVSHQILNTVIKEEPAILEIHRRSDATAINIGLNAEELDVINELAATPQTESISELNEGVSTEMVSEVPTFELDTAEIAVDEVHEVSVLHPEESIKELESIDESEHQVESQTEVTEAVSIETSPEGEEIVADKGSLVGTNQFEKEPLEIDSQETESAVTEENKNGIMEQEVQTLTQKEDQILHNITDQVQVEDKDQPPEEVEELKQLAAVQAATLDSEECSVQLLEEEIIAVDIPATEPVTHEIKEEREPLSQDNVEAEKEDELQADAAKSEHEEEPGVLEAVQKATLDSDECSAQLLREEVISEDIPATEPVTHETKEETEPLTEDNVEGEKEDELQADAAKSEHEEEPGVLEAVQTATLDSYECSAQLLKEEVISEDIPATELGTHETKEETEPLTEDNVEGEKEDELQADAAKSEHEEEPGVLEAVQTATLDSEEGSAQLLEKEVISEDIPATETVTHKTKEETEPLTEDNVEAKMEDKLQADAAKSEHEGPEVLEAVQTATLDSEENRVQAEVLSEDIPTAESAADETKPAMENLTEISIEPENKELKTDTLNIDNQQVAEVLQAMQVPTLDSEEGSVQSIEREVILEATPEVETITDELKEETEPLVEDSEPVDAFKTEHVGELQVLEVAQVAKLDSEEDSVQSLEKEVISEEVSPTETAELTQAPESSVEPEELPVEDAKTDIVQEPEVLPSDVKGIATEAETEVETSMPAHVVTESVEEGGAQEPEKQILSEDGPETDTKNAIASVTDETESKIMAELNQTLKIHEDLKTERTPQDVQVGQEDHIAEVVGELQALTAVHVSSVNEDARSVQVRETVFSEVTPATLVDNAAVTHEPKHGVHLSAVHASVEGEKEGELPGAEIKNAAVEHSVVTEVITCYLKDVSTAIPDVLMEKTSDIHEPLIDTVSSKLEFEETVMTTTPLMKDEVTETAEEGSVVMMMNVPSVQLEDNHRIQVQVVDVDIKSAKTIVDTVLVVGVTEDKEVIDVCHETVKEVDMLSATSKTEELINKESKVIVQEVIQHVKEKLPETVPESMPVNLEQKVMKQPDAVTNMSEIAERQVFEDVTQTPDIPESLDVSIHDHKEDLEEPEAGLKRSEADVKTEEVKLSSEELDVKTISEETQITQIAQSQIVTPSNTGLVVPQNTGTISSIGNVESPSSLSLEFKLNIQFGQAKAPASPPPATERIEPLKKTDVSEVGVQAEEPKKQIAPTQSAESQKQTELTEVAVQATEITEPEPDNLDSTERAVIMNEPVLLDVGMQAMETAEPTEEIKSTECVTPNVQAMETIQTVRQTEKREVFLSPPVVSEAFEQETKAREPVKQTEEENDQDVWLDAEEDIYTQGETEVALHEVEEPPEQQTESDLEKTVPQCELEMDPNSKIEEEQSQQEMLKTAICEIESEGEDFAVAPEHPETATGNITTTEWD